MVTQKLLVESTPPSNGFATSEFSTSAIATVLTAVTAFFSNPPEDLAQAIVRVAEIVSIALVAFGYNISRGMAKRPPTVTTNLPSSTS